MSLLITSLCVAGGVLLGRWATARKAAIEPVPKEPRDATERDGATKPDAHASIRNSMAGMDWSEFPCALGDVVSRLGTEERWLAGVIVFSEDRPAAALFIAPEAGGDRAIFARPKPNDDLLWLEPVPRDAILVGAEPPTSLELLGLRYERIRRLPLRAERAGAGAPDVGDTVVLAEYTSAGDERLILVITAGASARAWHGPSIGPGMYDVMPSGQSTLDES